MVSLGVAHVVSLREPLALHIDRGGPKALYVRINYAIAATSVVVRVNNKNSCLITREPPALRTITEFNLPARKRRGRRGPAGHKFKRLWRDQFILATSLRRRFREGKKKESLIKIEGGGGSIKADRGRCP
ncbi:hypothetical protein EVAR_98243_1 [Eumeta japonica]|uniref:Uncharacterized protein n=1 Tax=Eumeta variegata TaxID=151549 RepID=A0A4C1XYS9_EUMVA|nr:hypothetical protein EVAR_98243_1 [Eumeta japonica]